MERFQHEVEEIYQHEQNWPSNVFEYDSINRVTAANYGVDLDSPFLVMDGRPLFHVRIEGFESRTDYIMDGVNNFRNITRTEGLSSPYFEEGQAPREGAQLDSAFYQDSLSAEGQIGAGLAAEAGGQVGVSAPGTAEAGRGDTRGHAGLGLGIGARIEFSSQMCWTEIEWCKKPGDRRRYPSINPPSNDFDVTTDHGNGNHDRNNVNSNFIDPCK